MFCLECCNTKNRLSPKHNPKIVQAWPKIAPKWTQVCPKPSKNKPKIAQTLRRTPTGFVFLLFCNQQNLGYVLQQHFQKVCAYDVRCSSPKVDPSSPQVVPRYHKDGPNIAQDNPKVDPGRPQIILRQPQDGPNLAQEDPPKSHKMF